MSDTLQERDRILSELEEYGKLFRESTDVNYLALDDGDGNEYIVGAKEHYGYVIFQLYAELGALMKRPDYVEPEAAT